MKIDAMSVVVDKNKACVVVEAERQGKAVCSVTSDLHSGRS